MRQAPRRTLRALLLATLLAGCAAEVDSMDDDTFAAERERMVRHQLAGRDITEPRVLEAMRSVPRHLFVDEPQRHRAYADSPLPIGHGQTISQPYIVALMTQLARPQPGDRALEVGTGSGYQAAVLARLVAHVHTIELLAPLAATASERLAQAAVGNVTVRAGDGYAGWPDAAPFDVILVTAAPEQVPQPLIEQLRPGGRLVVPVGPVHAVQELQLLEKDASGEVRVTAIAPVRFVPLLRAADGGEAND
jgi:protein-L-isoaspartate(D-aspartate) O-methyltransferase